MTGSALSGEVVWRSPTTGVLPAQASAAPPVPGQPLAASYAGQRQAFGVGELVSLKPTVSGGSGRVEWWWPSIATLPAGLLFDTATGVFSGRTQSPGLYHWSLVAHDLGTGETAGAVAVLIIEP
ncbi:putative Ig domain-containing protein [Rhizobium ruizarguesonis]|uniref:putative Ig domain-containing protein n=1 Tax=Rhizobium ruizarguesonis TaxID=2081791 RepID=UPI003857EE26